MTSKRFFYTTITLAAVCVCSMMAFNYIMNNYGLFGDVSDRNIRIYFNERTSKYLLSFNYIPSKYSGILIGPSLSDNVNTGNISGYSIYNASLDGGNITEIKLIAENVITHGNLKFMIICLQPYLTKNHGLKSEDMNSRKYWGSLGSFETIKLYIYKILDQTGLSTNLFDHNGVHDYNRLKTNINSEFKIRMRAAIISRRPHDYPVSIDPIAYRELAELISLARRHGVKIFGYYYPVPWDYYILLQADYERFKEHVNSLFTDDDIIWDLNTPSTEKFRKDYSNYCDVSHLSYQGLRVIEQEIKQQLDSVYRKGS